MSFLKIDGVSKNFGKTHILKNIQLDLEKGSFLVLVGPSGCGKTTLLNIISGLEKESSGNIFLNGKKMNDLPAAKRDIAMVFQSYALYPNMTVAENITFGLEMRKVPKGIIAQKLREVSLVLKIDHLLKRKPAQLSGGQRQRVAMGRAIVRDPLLFLFDEPLSNLDAKLRLDMRMEIKKLHKNLNVTVVYVTHDQVEAMTLADQIAVMNGGEVEQVGSPFDIYYNPINMFTSSFMGSPSMNYLRAGVEKVGSGYKLMVMDLENQVECPLSNPPSAIDQYIGKEIILGLRPEAILLKKMETASFQKKVEVVEMTGAESYLLLLMDKKEVLVKVETSESIQPNQSYDFYIDSSRAVLFDPVSQKNLKAMA